MLDPNPNEAADARVDTGFDAMPVTATVSPNLAPPRLETGFGDLDGTSGPVQQAMAQKKSGHCSADSHEQSAGR